MLLDNKLNLNHHIDHMYKKVNSRLGILSEIRKFIFDVTASRIVTRFGKMSRKSPKVQLRYGPRKSE